MSSKKILKILIIDDDVNQINILTQILNREGFNVFSAQNGNEGIIEAKNLIPDMILMDYMMPITDGITALKLLKANTITCDIPVIMLSANIIDAMGCTFLRKPFSAQTIISTIKSFESTKIIY